MALQRVPLRLPPELRAEVERLRGDRVLNTCLIRAVEQWCARERHLLDATVLGLYEDGTPVGLAVVPAAVGARSGGVAPSNGDGRAVAAGHGQTAPPAPDPAEDEDLGEDPAEPDPQLQIDAPPRRRPPARAEQWGSGTQ